MSADSPSSVLDRPPAEPLLGCEVPRVFTPPLRELTPETTVGFAVIAFASEVLELELLPWQKWLALHALELLPDGTFRFRTVILLVGRQNGKSTFLQVLALFFLYIRGVALVIGTAQNLDVAEEVWQGAVNLAESVPDLADEVHHVNKTNGKKALVLVDGQDVRREGPRYKVQTSSRRGGRGLSGDLVMLDELREHQNWLAWGAVSKTTMARSLAQVWGVSNAGDKASVVLRYLRRLAHLTLGDPDSLAEQELEQPSAADDDIDDEDLEPDDESLGIFEWSATPGCKITDRDGWRQANPSLGHTITARAISSAARTDPEAVFRTEVLCQWVDTLTPSAISVDLWADLADPQAPRGTRVSFGVDIDTDRQTWIAIVWERPDGLLHVVLDPDPVPAHQAAARCKELTASWGGRVWLGGTSAALATDLKAKNVDHDTVKAGEFASVCGLLEDRVAAGTIKHGNQPALNTAVAGSRWRPRGTSNEREFDLIRSMDVGPLAAAGRAIHGHLNAPPVDVEETIW